MLDNFKKDFVILNKKLLSTLKAGDSVFCIENRHVGNINPVTLAKIYNGEIMPFLTAGKEYEVISIQPTKGKVIIKTDDDVERPVHMTRLAIKNEIKNDKFYKPKREV